MWGWITRSQYLEAHQKSSNSKGSYWLLITLNRSVHEGLWEDIFLGNMVYMVYGRLSEGTENKQVASIVLEILWFWVGEWVHELFIVLLCFTHIYVYISYITLYTFIMCYYIDVSVYQILHVNKVNNIKINYLATRW